MLLKKILKKILFFLGFRLIRNENLINFSILKNKDCIIALYNSRGVLHIGAHLCQEADAYNLFQKKVIWIEANPDIYNESKDKISFYRNQQIYCALLGDGEIKDRTFFISNDYGASSSLFEFNQNYRDVSVLNPDLKMKKKITLPMLRLETFVEKNNINISEFNYWVLDVQGSELLVLKGAENLLRSCDYLLIEVHKVPIYSQGVLFQELKNWLKLRNFYPANDTVKVYDDVLFIKKSKTIN
jgi:FkbM family methyltransferase